MSPQQIVPFCDPKPKLVNVNWRGTFFWGSVGKRVPPFSFENKKSHMTNLKRISQTRL